MKRFVSLELYTYFSLKIKKIIDYCLTYFSKSYMGVYFSIVYKLIVIWKWDALLLIMTAVGLMLTAYSMIFFPQAIILLSQAYINSCKVDVLYAWIRMGMCTVSFALGSALRFFSIDYLSEHYLHTMLLRFKDLVGLKYLPVDSVNGKYQGGSSNHLSLLGHSLNTVKNWISRQMSQTVRFMFMFLGSVFCIITTMPFVVSLLYCTALVIAQGVLMIMEKRRAATNIIGDKNHVGLTDKFQQWVDQIWRYPLSSMRFESWETLVGEIVLSKVLYYQSFCKSLRYFVTILAVLVIPMLILVSIFHLGLLNPVLTANFIMMLMVAMSSMSMLIEEKKLHDNALCSLKIIEESGAMLSCCKSIVDYPSVDQLTFYYNKIQVILKKGLWCLTGPNGAGKTTLLNQLRNPKSCNDFISEIHYTYSTSVHPVMLCDEIWEPSVVYCKTDTDTNVADCHKSRGQIQYASLAHIANFMLLNNKSPLFFLDDVFNSLDDVSQKNIMGLLKKMSDHQIIVLAVPKPLPTEDIEVSRFILAGNNDKSMELYRI